MTSEISGFPHPQIDQLNHQSYLKRSPWNSREKLTHDIAIKGKRLSLPKTFRQLNHQQSTIPVDSRINISPLKNIDHRVSQSFHNNQKHVYACRKWNISIEAFQSFMHEFGGNVYDSQGGPVFKAVMKDDRQMLGLLHELRVDFNVQDSAGDTPFKFAIHLNKLKMARLLIDYQVDLNFQDSVGYTPLTFAIFENRIEFINLIVEKGANVNLQDKMGWTPLRYAIFRNAHAIVTILVDRGADVNLPDTNGITSLNYAMSLSDHHLVVNFLVRRGAKIKRKGSDAEILLRYAILQNDVDLFDYLIYRDEKVLKIYTACKKLHISFNRYLDFTREFEDGVFHSKGGPLFKAIVQNDIEMIKLIQALGVNVNLFNKTGDSPLLSAVSLDRLEIIKILIESGADVNIKSLTKLTPLICAVSQKNIKTVEILVKNGADPNSDVLNTSPLTCAIAVNQEDILRFLLKNGADPNLSLPNNIIPLIKAIIQNCTNCVKILIEYGADVNFIDKFKHIPLMYTEKSEMIQTLILKGADKKYARDFFGKTLLAQVCGLKGHSYVTRQNGQRIKISLEAMLRNYAASHFCEYVKRYFAKQKSKDFPLSKKSRSKIEETFARTHSIKNSDRLELIRKGEPCVIVGGSRLHTIVLLLFRNQLFVCNRGAGKKDNEAVETFDLPAIDVTQQMLEKFSKFYEEPEDFNHMIQELHLPEKEGYKQQDQKAGNCSWANIKAAFGVLCRLYSNPLDGWAIYKDATEYFREFAIADYVIKFNCEPNDDCLKKFREKLKEKSFEKGFFKIRKILFKPTNRFQLLQEVKRLLA